MTFVTEDIRVKNIVKLVRDRKLTREEAARTIRDLPPQKDSSFQYLEWEVQEALA